MDYMFVFILEIDNKADKKISCGRISRLCVVPFALKII